MQCKADTESGAARHIRAALLPLMLCVAMVDAPVVHARSSSADNCRSVRQPFTKIKNFLAEEAAKGAILGALVGGLGAAAGDENVLAGAALGAVAGGVVGYVAAKEQAARNRAELLQAIDQDYQASFGGYSELPKALVALGECRRGQIASVEQARASGTMTVKAATKRLDQIEKWIAEDDRTIAKAAGKQAATITSYTEAMAIAEGATPPQDGRAGWALARYDASMDSSGALTIDELDAMGMEIAAIRSVQNKPGEPLYVAAAGGARVRAAPSLDAPVVTTLADRTRVSADLGRAIGWAFVWTPSGQAGYVSLELLRREKPAVRVATKPASKAYGADRVRGAVRAHADLRATRARERASTTARLAAARQLLRSA